MSRFRVLWAAGLLLPFQLLLAQVEMAPGGSSPHGEMAPAAPVVEEGPLRKGQVEVSIVNKTAGSDAILEGLEVRLFSFTGTERKQELTGESGPDGRVGFADVEISASRKYIVSTLFQGVRYVAHEVSFTDGADVLPLTVEVYESTGDDTSLSLEQLHLVVSDGPEGAGFGVNEILVIKNAGDKTVIGSKDDTLTLKLDVPESITDFTVMEGFLKKQVLVGQGMVGYTGPIYPGQTQAVLAYVVPGVNSFFFRRRFPIPVGQVTVFTPKEGPELSSSQLSRPEPLEIEGKQYQRYLASAGAIQKGLTFKVSRPAAGGEASSAPMEAPEIPAVPVAVVLGLFLLAYITWPLFQPGKVTVQLPADQRRAEDLQAEKERRLRDVVDIDHDFAVGKLSREDYEPLRAEYKARAVEILALIEGENAGAAAPTAPEVAVPHQQFCTACGSPVLARDRFCAMCGTPLRVTTQSG